MSYSATDQAEIVEIDDATAAREVFDAVCSRELGISGDEFLGRWDAGEYRGVDVDSVEGLSEVVAALPMIR